MRAEQPAVHEPYPVPPALGGQSPVAKPQLPADFHNARYQLWATQNPNGEPRPGRGSAAAAAAPAGDPGGRWLCRLADVYLGIRKTVAVPDPCHLDGNGRPGRRKAQEAMAA